MQLYSETHLVILVLYQTFKAVRLAIEFLPVSQVNRCVQL